MIIFNADTHTYTNTITNEKYISVTTLLGKYKQHFDKETHSLRVSQREGVSQQMVLDAWSAENKKATDKGTKIHKLMENFILHKTTISGLESLYTSYNEAVATVVGNYNKVIPEGLLFNHDSKVAGTADLIFENKNGFIIGDFKTNKKFNFTSKYNTFLKSPVQHLTECEFNTYALQLSLYAYMYEQLTNTKCLGLFILFLKETKWLPIHCNYLKHDISEILRDYRLNSINNEERNIA
jgi:ATP-dependent exoDNAse (exonuclease V) beta subunit